MCENSVGYCGRLDGAGNLDVLNTVVACCAAPLSRTLCTRTRQAAALFRTCSTRRPSSTTRVSTRANMSATVACSDSKAKKTSARVSGGVRSL
eukprot:CAMPEP_0173198904 /NCGR_PEP_ID=MMETSP1141-20130122/16941_1 /TAXON_ID=483371 /ORGANISM="non described non described, Strain CCMP2298" /LENGTH=92 /DNA_ID=CAMNT_0014123739 /DNA_START=685 /DNA_END=963 /DNA_ORIENTATION=+